jgi:hypothetical protein
MNQEHRLMDTSNAIETPAVMATRVNAKPMTDRIQQILDSNAGATIKAQAQKALGDLNKSIDANGTIAFESLKDNRSLFEQYLDTLATPSTGSPTVRNTLERKLNPIKAAMTDTMAAAVDSTQPGLGAQWRANDDAWSEQGAMKHNLADTGGVLTPDRTGFNPSPGGKQVGKLLTSAVSGDGKKGTAPINQIEEGLGEQPARSAVAEVIASMGRPKNADSTQSFRPSTWGEGYKSNVDADVKNWIEEKAGPEAAQHLENAAEAGSRTSEPREQGGLRKAIGSVVAAAPYAATGAAIFHPALLPFAALSPLLTSAQHDPDFVRAMAGRPRPFSDLIPQLLTHAGLGSNPNFIDPVEGVRQGVGAGANAVRSGVNAAADTIPSILKYLSQPPAPSR